MIDVKWRINMDSPCLYQECTIEGGIILGITMIIIIGAFMLFDRYLNSRQTEA